MTESNPLRHLTEEELAKLIARYYAGEKVVKLLLEFRVDCTVGLLTRYFPPKPTDESCRYCRSPLIRPYYPRNGFYIAEIRCSGCDHEESSRCCCPGCTSVLRLARANLLREQQQRGAEYCLKAWDYSPTNIEPNDLSARDAVALVALVRSCGWLDDQRIGALRTAKVPFAPVNSDFQLSMLNGLINAGIAAPDPESRPYAFKEDKGGVVGWHHDEASWRLRLPNPAIFVESLEDLIASNNWPQSWGKECIDFSYELASMECWEFFVYSAAKRNFPPPSGAALMTLIKNLLRDFSVSQCYQLFWTAGKDAADFRARKRISTLQAANYMVEACQRHADRSRAEGWRIIGHARKPDLERSQISRVLHDFFLDHGDVTFQSPLSHLEK